MAHAKILVYDNKGNIIYKAGKVSKDQASEIWRQVSAIKERGIMKVEFNGLELLVRVEDNVRGVLWY